MRLSIQTVTLLNIIKLYFLCMAAGNLVSQYAQWSLANYEGHWSTWKSVECFCNKFYAIYSKGLIILLEQAINTSIHGKYKGIQMVCNKICVCYTTQNRFVFIHRPYKLQEDTHKIITELSSACTTP